MSHITTWGTSDVSDSTTASNTNATTKARTRNCKGVALGLICCMRLPSEKRREVLILGFKHACREAFNQREPMSHPSDDKWNYCLPVVGVLANGNDPTDIRWTLEEHHHSPDLDQFEYMAFHATHCSHEEMKAGEEMCSGCIKRKTRIM